MQTDFEGKKNVLQGSAWPWYILQYDTEKLLKAAIIATEHAVVLDRVREETSQDGVHCCVNCSSQTIQKGTWESSKRDAELMNWLTLLPSQGLELYKSQGPIFHMERIILPANLLQKVINPFAPELPVTARAEPRLFYGL